TPNRTGALKRVIESDRMIRKCESASRSSGRIPHERPIRRRISHPCSFWFLQIFHRTDFYGSFAPLTRRWDSLGPLDRFVQVLAFKDVIAGELFLRFGEWPVNRDRQPILHPHARCSASRFQFLAADQNTSLPSVGHHRSVPRRDSIKLFGRKRLLGFLRV